MPPRSLLLMKIPLNKTPIWAMAFLFGFLLFGCSRSPWIHDDGHEVRPRDHVKCVKSVHQESQGEALDQEVLEERIEKCMVEKGYHRRPWWYVSDLHWHTQ